MKYKFQNEKDKNIILKEDIQNIINRLFNSEASSFDNSRLKLLKDLKIHAILKYFKDYRSILTTVIKVS